MLRTPRTPITILLVALGALAFFYQLLSAFPSLSSNLRTTLQHALPASNYCTKDIGEGVCCDLFMAAEPCVEDCREQHMDRETFALTQEFDACSTQCMTAYRAECGDDEAREGAAGDIVP